MLTTGTEVGAGRYLVEDLLGQGGMAAVYRVRHAQLGTPLALKVLTSASPDQRDRLMREGRAQAALRHSNIVSVVDVVEIDGLAALVMEFIDGPDLAQVLEQRALSADQADDLMRGILAGVAAAHDQGFVHRDLKPGNILLAAQRSRPVPRVADFGLVKQLSERVERATRTGAMMGTPAYMAPEQVRDAGKVDARADVFALGAIAYELFSGRRAFEGEDAFEIFEAIVKGRHVPVSEAAPSLSPRLVAVIERALSTDPDARFADAGAMEVAWLADAPPLSMASLWAGDALVSGSSSSGTPSAPASSGSETFAVDEAEVVTVAPTVEAPEAAPPEVSTMAPESNGQGPARPRWVAPVLVLGTLVAGGLFAWDQTREKTGYYQSVRWEQGAPVGVAPGGPELLSRYAITTKGGRAIRVEHQTGAGTALRWPERMQAGVDGLFVDGVHLLDHAIFPCERVVPGPHGEGQLTLCGARNATQRLLPSTLEVDWGPSGVVERRWTTPEGERIRTDRRHDEGDLVVWSHLDRWDQPIEGPWKSPYTVESWDDAGRVREVRQRGLDGAEAVDDKGMVGLRFERDAEGRIVREEELGLDGPRDLSRAPIRHGLDYDGGAIVRETWRDGTDTPTPGPGGCATVEIDRDDALRPVAQRCLDREGAPAVDRLGCASKRLEWSERRLTIRCLDETGAPAVDSQGSHEIRVALDAHGLPVDARFFGTDGDPAHMMIDVRAEQMGHGPWGRFAGPARLQILREPGPRISGVRWFDIQGDPQLSPEGWTGWDVARDPLGRITQWTLIGPDDQPVEGDLGAAIVRIERDEGGGVAEEAFFDAAGEPTLNVWGFHIDRNAWQRGRMTRWRHYDLDGEPTPGPRSAFEVRTSSDAIGRTTELALFGVDGEPITAPDGGYHRTTFAWGLSGVPLEAAWFDVEGNPVAGPNGCAVQRRSTNADRSEERLACLGPSGEPAASSWIDGHGASAVWKLWRGHHVGIDIFDVDGKRTQGARYQLNARGQIVGVHHYDPNGVVMRRTRYELDHAGNQTKEWSEDEDGNLVAGLLGAALIRKTFDRGQPTRIESFDADEQPMVSRFGMHRLQWEYDHAGRRVSKAVFGVQGEPIVDPSEGSHAVRWSYDARGNPIRTEWIPVPGTRLPEGAIPVRSARYDAQNHLLEAWVEDLDGNRIDVADAKSGADWNTVRCDYDERGRRRRVDWLLADGRPAVCEAGFSSLRVERAPGTLRLEFLSGEQPVALGEGASWPFAGPDEGRVPVPEPRGGLDVTRLRGMAGLELTLDPWGALVELAFLGTDGQPTAVNGVARARQTWSADHHPTRLDWVDADGQATVFPREGYASILWERDAHGRAVRTEYLGADGDPRDGPDGWARWVVVRDGAGRPLEERFYRADGSEGRDANGCHRILRTFRWGEKLTETCEAI